VFDQDLDVVSHKHWYIAERIFACLIYRGQHIHTDSLHPKATECMSLSTKDYQQTR